MKSFNFINQKIRCVSGVNLNLSRYAAMVLVLLLGVGSNAWASHGGACTATLEVKKGTGSGSVYAATTGSATSGSSSVSADCGNSDGGTHTRTFYAFATPADGYTFLGWTESATSTAGADASNPKAVTITSNSHSTVTKTLYAHFVEKAQVNITFEAPSNGTYTIKVNGGSTETVSSANVVKSNVEGVTLTATPASGYAFAGWYKLNSAGEFVEDLSIANPYDAAFTKSETIKMGARFVPTTLGKFILKGSDTQYYGLKMATIAAGGSGTIVPVADETLVDGSDLMPFDNGTYSIKAGATLLVPYSSANTVQTTPQIITTAATLSAYKTLVFTDGVNVECDGTICVGGQIMAGSGGSMSGYVSGPCGMINMANGGHIELNSGAKLYCWGFVKGQDMDQGNNTVGVGTITANSGAEVWENLGIGDWRGGTATSTIKDTRFFPFQSYFIQNIEVPLTIEYGAAEKNYIALNAAGGPYNTSATTIGSSKALFLLKDANSTFRKWYDPTTDLTCFELSGTSQIDALSITIDALFLSIDVNSSDFDLPINSSMHIILTNSSVTLSKPMVLQPGAVIEVKNDANITLSSNAYLYDKDNWGAYAGPSYYFHSYPNLTSHKNRGNGQSNNLLDDAKVIVDGTVSVTGKLYSTAAGANVMGNGGGKIVFSTSLPTATTIPAFTGNGDAVSGGVAVNSANLCNEDESYTKAIASTTFYNVHGRWFKSGNQNEKANHTYDFTYISSGAVSGTSGTSTNPAVSAVYAPDKTGLTAGMKWCNVAQDATCSNIYNATQALNETPASDIRYTYPSSSWLQLLKTETEGVYGGSDNSLYAVDGCAVNSLGSVDENCLYTINDVKKALVDGHFVALEKNTEDEAWHDVANPTNYYISFEGCNWHPATKYAGEEKAYIVEEGDYIWYNNDWLLVEREDPFFFDYNEQNVKRYYEYEDGAWVLASPRVRVVDAIETRDFYFINEAFTVANGKKNTTITLLKDIPTITAGLTYSAKNTTCTLDLNGHILPGSISSMLKIDASGSTFTITDNSEDKMGRIELTISANERKYGLNITSGTVILNAGTIKAVNTLEYNSTSAKNTQICAVYAKAGTSFTMNGGSVIAESGHNPFGIYMVRSTSANTTVTINNGLVRAESKGADSPYGIYGTGTLNVTGGTIQAESKTTSAHGIYMLADATGAGNATVTGGSIEALTIKDTSYGIRLGANAANNTKATLNMSGGIVTATATTSTAMGIYVGRDLSYNTSEPRQITNYYYPVATISGGTVRGNTITSTTAEAVRSYGTLNISGGNFIAISGGDFEALTPSKSYAYGLRLWGGEAQISGTPTFTIKATTYAYGITSGDNAPAAAGGAIYNNTAIIDGGTFNVTTTGAYAYGAFVSAKSRAVTTTHASNSSYYAGNYANAGNVTINNGTFNVTAATSNVYGIYLEPAVSQSGASGYTTATAVPVCTVNNGTITATAQTSVSHGAYISAGARLTVIDGTLKGKLTKVAAGGWATGTQVLGGGTLDATGGTFIGESANSGLSAKQKSYAVGILANTNATNGGSNVSVSNATLYGELKSTYLTNGGSGEWEGGAYGLYSKTANDLTLTNCTIQAVSAYQGGFGIRLLNTPAEIHDCTVTINTTYAYNYGIFTEGTADAKVYNSSFTATSGTTYAYGAYVYGGALTAEDSEFNATTNQTASSSISASNLHGIRVNTGKKVTLTDCTVAATGNANYSQDGYGMYIDGSADVTNSTITVSSVKKNAYAVFNTANTTLINLYSGKFKASAGTGTILACNGTAAAANQVITGGYYSTNTNLSKYTTAPYQVLTLPNTHTEYANGYRYKVAEAYTVTFMNGSEQLQSDYIEKGVKPAYAGTPSKEADAQYSYNFDGWTANAEGTGTVYTASTLPAVSAAATYFAHFTKTEQKYSVDVTSGGHGSVSPASVSNIGCETASGDITATPATGYSFSGWTLPEGVTVADGYTTSSNPIRIHATAAEKTITANFAARTDINYTVRHFQQNIADNNYTEVTADAQTLHGTTATATNAVAKNYTGFTAQAFEQGIVAGDGSTVVEIYYNRKTYTITWVDGNGTTIETDEHVKYGATPSYTGETPTKTATAQYTYTFNNTWSPAFVSVTGDATYTAQFGSTINQYTLTIATNNAEWGTVDGGGLYDYNSAHTITATPKAGFKFVKWNDDNTENPRSVTVTADVTYTATFDYDIANYTVKHWLQNINDDDYTEVEADRQTDLSGTIGESTAAVANTYIGFTLKSPIEQKTIALNNTVVNIYYDRITYTIIWEVKLNGEQEAYKEETLRYGAMPSYGSTPTKEQSESEVYAFSGWTPTPYAVDKDETYNGSFKVSPRPYTITFVNDNGVGLQSSDVNYGLTPSYDGSIPVSSHTGDGYTYTFSGWKPELALVSGPATYTAVYSRSADAIVVNTPETVVNNTIAPTTTVEDHGTLTIGDTENDVTLRTNVTVVENGGELVVTNGSSIGEEDTSEESIIIVESGGQLDVKDGGSVEADVFIIQATTEDKVVTPEVTTEVQVSGELSETGSKNVTSIYYDLTRKGGTEPFLARVWYAVAVPWAVEVPNYANGGVFIKRGEEYVPQRLGTTFDLISYDGECRAKNGAGANCWVYLEDEPEEVMVPGKLYMIYLTEETYTIRFKKKVGVGYPIHTNSLTVSPYAETTSNEGKDANWNGIANPATYNAYMNVSVGGLVQKFVPGTQPRDGGRYLITTLNDKQAVGQPFFVQVNPEGGTSVMVTRTNASAAPRRAQAEGDKEVRYAIGIAANGKLADRLYIQTAEEKEDKYVIGQDMSKMGISNYVAQIWVARYDAKLCQNTVAMTRDKAVYPLGIYAPQAGEYMIFAPTDMEPGDNIYLTKDGRVIWNLTMAPYYATLEQGTTTNYGLRLIRSNAPAVTTGVDEVQGENAQCTKVIMDDHVYILRGEELYTITGQKAK